MKNLYTFQNSIHQSYLDKNRVFQNDFLAPRGLDELGDEERDNKGPALRAAADDATEAGSHILDQQETDLTIENGRAYGEKMAQDLFKCKGTELRELIKTKLAPFISAAKNTRREGYGAADAKYRFPSHMTEAWKGFQDSFREAIGADPRRAGEIKKGITDILKSAATSFGGGCKELFKTVQKSIKSEPLTRTASRRPERGEKSGFWNRLKKQFSRKGRKDIYRTGGGRTSLQ